MSCPNNVKIRASILCRNGFGFQGPGEGIDDMFVPCKCKYLSDDQLKRLKKMSGATTVKCGDWIGNEYISVHWTEYDKIPDVLTSLLQMGISFTTMTALKVQFNANKHKKYTPEIEELEAMKMYDTKYNADYKIFDLFAEQMFDIWNWKTNSGKEFCQRLRSLTKKIKHDLNDERNYYNWELFKNCDLSTLLDKCGYVIVNDEK